MNNVQFFHTMFENKQPVCNMEQFRICKKVQICVMRSGEFSDF